MYFYPDNLLESILIFQKGKFDYKSILKEDKEKARIDKKELQDNKWYSTLWEMTNVLPNAKLEKGIAAFPIELPYRFIKLFSYQNETILDPFCGSGSTLKMARKLHRNSIGIEIKKNLEPIITEKLGFGKEQNLIVNSKDTYEVIIRRLKNIVVWHRIKKWNIKIN